MDSLTFPPTMCRQYAGARNIKLKFEGIPPGMTPVPPAIPAAVFATKLP